MAAIAAMIVRGLTLSADQVVEKMREALTPELAAHVQPSYQNLLVSMNIRKATLRRLRRRCLLHYGTFSQRAIVAADIQRERVWRLGSPITLATQNVFHIKVHPQIVSGGPQKKQPKGTLFGTENGTHFGCQKNAPP